MSAAGRPGGPGALGARAPGKVNLCLFVGPVRSDGRHDLVSLLQCVSLADDVKLGPAALSLDADEVVCPGVAGPNLAERALREFRSALSWRAPPQRLTIEKRIPIAAGMGGGSADAAATLRLAAQAAGRDLDGRVTALAAGLGSDVPALLEPGLVLVAGAGERVRRVAAVGELAVVLVPGNDRLSTAHVYAQADRLKAPRSEAELAACADAVGAAVAAGRLPDAELLVNDLERAARSLCPAIDVALEAVRATGAQATLVSGSGPTVFGLWTGPDAGTRAETAAAELSPQFPSARAATPVGPEFGAPVAA